MQHIYRKPKDGEDCWVEEDGTQYIIKAVNNTDKNWFLANGWSDTLEGINKSKKKANGNDNQG